MPAKSKSQQRLFGLALSYKRGELDNDKVNDTIIKLSELPEKTLKKYAKTKHKNLPEKIDEVGSSFDPSLVQGDFGGGNLPYARTKQRVINNLLQRSNKYRQDLESSNKDDIDDIEKMEDGIITYSEFIKRHEIVQETGAPAATALNTPGMGNVTPVGDSGIGSGDMFPSFSEWWDDEEDEDNEDE